MYVDHVAYGTVDLPAGAQEPLARPSALGKEVLREFGLLLGCDRLNIAGVYGLSVRALPLVREEIPNFHAA